MAANIITSTRRRLAWAALGGLAVLISIIVFNTLKLTSKQLSFEAVKLAEVDNEAVLSRLSGSIQIPTVSHQDPALFEPEAFLSFHRFRAR